MKTMTCKQLGGACDKAFSANTFEELASRLGSKTQQYTSKYENCLRYEKVESHAVINKNIFIQTLPLFFRTQPLRII